MPANFVHLRLHTAYSLAESTLRIEDLSALIFDDKQPAAAITEALKRAKGKPKDYIICVTACGRVEKDLEYQNQWSLTLDLIIIFKTIFNIHTKQSY